MHSDGVCVCAYVCVCVCMCVCERERERLRGVVGGWEQTMETCGDSPEDCRTTCVWEAGLSHLISILRDWHCPRGHNAWGHCGLLRMKWKPSRQCHCQSALTWAGCFIFSYIVYLCNHSLHKCKLIPPMFWLTSQDTLRSVWKSMRFHYHDCWIDTATVYSIVVPTS